MAYKITKNPDGDVSLGSINGEFVTLQPSSSDYAAGGYPIVSQVQIVDGSSLNANCDFYRVLAAIPVGGQGGVTPVWNPTTNKLQMWQTGSANSPESEVPAGTDLSAYAFQLLLLGF
jgi:hypothetical protein